MLKKMTKVFKVFCLILVVGILLTSCDTPSTGGNDGDDSSKITTSMLEALTFDDVTVPYDGEEHSIFIDNIYEEQGVKITYMNNGKTLPGEYKISAAIKYNGKSIFKEATLIIEKGVSVLEADEAQTFNLVHGKLELKYNSNNETNQELVMLNEDGEIVTVSDLIQPGIYNIEIYLKSNSYYADSNHVSIILNVVSSQFDISFDTTKVIADGEEHILELVGTLPTGYTVEYENNKGTVDGKYYAVAKIKDTKGEVVETHRAVLIIDNPENVEFKEYLDDFFAFYLEGDQLSVNIFCENPLNFGLEHYEAKWYSFTSFGDEEIAHDLQLFKDLLVELEEFSEAELNDLQETAYETIRKFLQQNVDYYSIEDSFFMEITYVDQFGGYVADFGTYMEAYSLRTEAEVQDIVDYIESTKTAFPSYLDFLQLKVDKGYPLSNYTINEMRNYLYDLIMQGENYYLKEILFEKIDKLEFLTDSEKTSYKNEIATAIKENFVVGVQALYDGLDDYLNVLEQENEGYWATYENGRELYIHELEKKIGCEDLDVNAYIKEIDSALKASVRSVISTQQAVLTAFNASTWEQLQAAVANAIIFDGTPEEMMVYLKEFAKTIVPELQSDPNIVIKEMDQAAAKVSNAVAYYMKSALDNTGSEYITLNPVQLRDSSSTDVLGTLAHEGYPGHLYAYIYSKELGLSNLATIMTSVGHAEGWATYVELALYEYAKDLSNDPKFDIVMDYLYANQISSFLLETRLDAGIHLEGWGINEISIYMSNLGYSADSAESIYDLLIEMPTQYVSYGYGKLVFVNLHNEAQRILGMYYDEVEFNAMLLSKGWTDLTILEETYEEYMMIKCHEYGIAYN